MENCLFCKIVEKKIPARVVFESDHVLAFLDVTPRAVGHTLVIPKIHAPNLLELPEFEVAPLFLAVREVGEKLHRSLHPDGFTIGANQGRSTGQEVDHLHVHIMPRWKGDGGHAIQSVVNAPPQESLDILLRKIIHEGG